MHVRMACHVNRSWLWVLLVAAKKGSWQDWLPRLGLFDFVSVGGTDLIHVVVQLLWVFGSASKLGICAILTCGLVGRVLLVPVSLTRSEVAVHEVRIGCCKVIRTVRLVQIFSASGLLSLLGLGRWEWFLLCSEVSVSRVELHI